MAPPVEPKRVQPWPADGDDRLAYLLEDGVDFMPLPTLPEEHN